MNPLRAIVTRHQVLLDLRADLAAEIGVRVWTRATDWALDVLTVVTATSCTQRCRADPRQHYLARLISPLWRAVEVIGGAKRIESAAQLFTERDRAACAEAALYAAVGAAGMFRAAARGYLRTPASLDHALASALVLPTATLGGCRWETAPAPLHLVRRKAMIHHRVDDLHHGGGEIRRTDALYCARARKHTPLQQPERVPAEQLCYDYIAPAHRGTATLEEIADSPGEAIAVRRYVRESLDVLRRATEGDADLEAYLRTRVNVGGKAQDTWRLLGWTDARGQRVDRRFRRLCVGICGRNDLADIEYLPATRSTSMANHTVFREVLYGGRHGSEIIVYQHVPTH
jgi:hypothetical protein